MNGDVEYEAKVLDLPPDVKEAWRTIYRRYREMGEVLIACINVTVKSGEPSIQFLRHDSIQNKEDMIRALDALEYAVRRVRNAILIRM